MNWPLDDLFVGSVAVILGLIALVFSAWTSLPAQGFWLVRAVEQRFGTFAARLCLLAIAILLFALGGAIIGGYRPRFATTPHLLNPSKLGRLWLEGGQAARP